METKVRKIRHRDGRAYEVVAEHPDGATETYPCDEVISSMPLTKLVRGMDPAHSLRDASFSSRSNSAASLAPSVRNG